MSDSPLEEAGAIAADAVWAKIAASQPLTDAEITALVLSERAEREAWNKSAAAKKIKREEKETS